MSNPVLHLTFSFLNRVVHPHLSRRPRPASFLGPSPRGRGRGDLVAMTNSVPSRVSAASSWVRRNDVGSAQCRSSSARTVGPLATSRASTARTAAKLARCRPSGLSRSGRPHRVGARRPMMWPEAPPGRAGPRRQPLPPLQGRAQHFVALLGGNPGPGGQELLVEPIGGRRAVGGTAALQPEGEPPGPAPHPGHEALAAFLDQAGLAQTGLAKMKANAGPGYGLAQGAGQGAELCLPAGNGCVPGYPAPTAIGRRARPGTPGRRPPPACPAARRPLPGSAPNEHVLRCRPGDRPDQDRGGPRRRLQSGGGGHDLAYGAVPRGRRRSALPRRPVSMPARTDRLGRPTGWAWPRAPPKCGSLLSRPARVVLVSLGRTEKGGRPCPTTTSPCRPGPRPRRSPPPTR